MSSIILILTLISCVLALISIFFKKDFKALQKTNAIIYILFTTAFICFLSTIINYLKITFLADYSYIDILNNLFLLSTFIGAVLIIIGVFFTNENYQKYAYRLYDIGIVVFTIIMAINILYSNSQFAFMAVPLIMTSLLNISMMVNASEQLKNNASKGIYFSINAVIGAFWIICMVLFINKITTVSASIAIIIVTTLILSFSGLIFGLINSKKESK